MSQTDTWTIGRLLTWTTDFLKQHHAESPRLDAEVLLAHARGCERIQLYTAFDQLADEPLRERFRGLVKRRAAGEPVAYLVGHREFYSLSFLVEPGVLIPRPETEFLVVTLLDLAKASHDQPLRIADVGTGSGILAICAAKYLSQARVWAIDQSATALEIARKNAERHGVADRIEFSLGDLLGDLPEESSFDFIVSNPPYVSSQEYERLPATVQQHEPRAALLAGPRGDEVIARLVPQAARRLVPGGWLLIEMSPMIADRVLNLLEGQAGFDAPRTVKDLAGHRRVAFVKSEG